MLSSNIFSETRIQRLLDGLIFVEKGLGVHVHRMLKMSRGLYIGGNFKQNAWKKAKENWGPYLRSLFDKLTIWCQLIFIKSINCDYCLYDYHLYIWKMLTNREMVYFRKWDLFRFLLYTFTINCVTTGARKSLLSLCFALFIANNA